METSRSQFNFDSRYQAVDLATLNRSKGPGFELEVASVRIKVRFAGDWGQDFSEMCRSYWAPFVVSTGGCDADLELVLAPAQGEFVRPENSLWNEAKPFQRTYEDSRGSWLFHRDFVALRQANSCHAWLPRPTPEATDAIDNVLAICVRSLGEKRKNFLFHSAVIEHQGRAVVFFGPSGIGKSTLAKFSRDWGLRVMASDQVYLRIEDAKLLASASPTCNPDVPRCRLSWATGKLEVKSLLALTREDSISLEPKLKPLDQIDMTRRFFAEVFRDETDLDFAAALKFAADVAQLTEIRRGIFGYPYAHNFWPYLQEIGYT